MAHRYFEGTTHALLYKKYRPEPPRQLIDRIITFLKQKYLGPLCLAYDVGCGSGQSTTYLSPYFKTVIGTDVSQSMILEASKISTSANVSYIVSPAENIPATSNSVQLITVSQAAHWFNLKRFYAEGYRVLCNGGVLAIFAHQFPSFRACGQIDTGVNSQLDGALDHIYRVSLKGFWSSERELVDGRYENIRIPYDDFTRDDSFYTDMDTSVADIANYIRTWSGYQKYQEKHGHEAGVQLILKFQNQLMEILTGGSLGNPKDVKLVKRLSYFLLMGRKG